MYQPYQDAESVSFSLASSTFIIFAFLACWLITVSRSSLTATRLSIGACNLVFLMLIGGSSHGLAMLAVFVHATFGLTWLIRRWPTRIVRLIGLAGVATLWLTLFINKNFDIFGNFSGLRFLDVSVIGLSYLAFRAISVLQEAEEIEDFNYIDFLNYMVFFPTILAGPIDRYDQFKTDVRASQPVDVDVLLDACLRITRGFIKKYVLADNLAPLGIFSFGESPQASSPEILWVAIAAQLLLIFLDFSGYSDIMIGIARLLGFRIQENFDRPYLARNIQDFWNSWHISLTFFVRDYVFSPICRLIFRHIPKRQQFPYITGAYFFTMLVIALWHKMSLGFLLFGVMHGLALTYIQIKRKFIDKSHFARTPLGSVLIKPPAPVAIFLTWIFFSLTTVVWFFPIPTTLAIFKKIFLL